MHFYDEQSESTCLFASCYSLSLSLSYASVISSQNQWLLTVQNVKTVNLRLTCPKEITKIPC